VTEKGTAMPNRCHSYDVSVQWTGNRGLGTRGYASYGRDHEVAAAAAPMIPGSSDPAFRGDPARWNPEQLLVASLSQCHMLWYLHLASAAGVIVEEYIDHAHGVMVEDAAGAGNFESVTLRPHVTIAVESDPQVALSIHSEVQQWCFIARSVNFPVHHEPIINTGSA